MNRSSGIVIFSSAYTMCILAIICCLHIKYNGQSLRQDKLISPQIKHLDSKMDEPIRYVLMNPIRDEFPIQLARRNSDPNILIASFPVNEVAAFRIKPEPDYSIKVLLPKREANVLIASLPAIEEPQVAKLKKPVSQLGHPKLIAKQNPWEMFKAIGRPFTDSPFKLAASRQSGAENHPAYRQPSTNASWNNKSLNHPSGGKHPSSVAAAMQPLEPHVAIANDFDGAQQIKEGLRLLAGIEIDQDLLDSVENEIDEIAFNGSMDSSLCEAAMHRILGQINQLASPSIDDEDARLLESVRDDITDQVHLWIDQLNGIRPIQLEYIPEDEIDYEKLNTALQSLFGKRVF